jgi:hypothetical protein
MNLKPYSSLLASCLLASSLVGCSKTTNAPVETVNAKSFAAPTGLTATLAQPAHIDLTWNHNATEAGAYWIEFATRNDDFVKVGAVWSHTPRFRHPDLAPETEHLYRVIPVFGPLSDIVEITTGLSPSTEVMLSEVEGPLEIRSLAKLGLEPLNPAGLELEPPPADTSSGDAAILQASVKTKSTAGKAAPANVTAALSVPLNVVLRWTDRAADEDGYLVEISTDPDQDFQICALLPSDTVSFRKILLAPETKYYFRVRAFFYGEPSNVASAVTGRGSDVVSASISTTDQQP